MSEHMQDDLQRSPNQWMQPMQNTQLGNGVTPRKLSDTYAGRYTPNEPDGNEAVYAAAAQAARRRRLGSAQAAPSRPEPETEAKPDAVLYSSSAGIPAFADSVPGEGAAATSRRRRRMEQRREENPPLPELQPSITFGEDTLRRKAEAERQEALRRQQEEAANRQPSAKEETEASAATPQAEGEPFAKQDSLRSRANAIHAAMSSQQLQAAFTTNPYAAATPAPPKEPPQPLAEKAEAAKNSAKQKLNLFNRKSVQTSNTEDGAETPLLVNSTNIPFGLKDGLRWTLTGSSKKATKSELSPSSLQAESPQAPEPAPATAVDVPKAKRANRWLTLLLVLMLLIAAGGYLTLSGLGEDLVHRAVGFYNAMTNKTIQTGTMSVVPETAAVPTTLLVTLSTDSTIADLRLLDDNGNILPADISCAALGNDCLWTARMAVNEPYVGFIRAQLLDKNGEWVIGSSSRYVNIN